MTNVAFAEPAPDCLFCRQDPGEYICENDLAYAVLDSYPVSEGHALIIPKRHAPTWFDLTPEEAQACNELVHGARLWLLKQHPEIDGFNVGVNCGEAAGQSIFHCHIHLIPRRKGDVANPQGGVRHVIASKAKYRRV